MNQLGRKRTVVDVSEFSGGSAQALSLSQPAITFINVSLICSPYILTPPNVGMGSMRVDVLDISGGRPLS